MVNKKLEISLGGETHQLWFNNFAVFDLQKMYGTDQSGIMQKINDRANDNFLLVLIDLIEVGMKGHTLAMRLPNSTLNINEIVANEDLGNLMKIWGDVWEVFTEHMGMKLPEDKKKVRTEKSEATKKS